MSFRRPFLLILVLLWGRGAATAAEGPEETHRAAMKMGAPLEIRVWGSTETANQATLDAGFAEIDRILEVFGTDLPDSPLSRFNASLVGTPMVVEPEIMGAAERSLAYHLGTEGAFDPALEPLTRLWDDDAGWTSIGWKKAFEDSGIDHFDVDANRAAITRLRGGSHFDFQGMIKGLAMDAAAEKLTVAGVSAARLTWEGQILAVGPQASQPLEVNDPTSGLPLARFQFDRGAVFVESQRRRAGPTGAPRWGPVIDPRNLHVVEKERIVTVLASSAEEADALASALLVLGAEDGAYLVTAHYPRAAALFMDKINGGWRLTPSSKFPKASLEILNEDAQITLP